VVEIAVRFTTFSGRYMYHCHILEHEDRDMMRPFVTMPAELMPFMA
jgi:FtsP/CotA-like multicopper oxidase with cupredoxin domain